MNRARNILKCGKLALVKTRCAAILLRTLKTSKLEITAVVFLKFVTMHSKTSLASCHGLTEL